MVRSSNIIKRYVSQREKYRRAKRWVSSVPTREARTPRQASVQQKIPQQWEVYVMKLHRLPTLQWQLRAKIYITKA